MNRTLGGAVFALVSFTLPDAHGLPSYVEAVPNCENPSLVGSQPCRVCHVRPQGDGERNDFGFAFGNALGAGTWSRLYALDSDGDGQTNGFELGDPSGVWTPGAVPDRTSNLSLPGDPRSRTRPPGFDAGVVDTGVVDLGIADLGPADGGPDAGSDGGPEDVGGDDAGRPGDAAADLGSGDAGSDGEDAGSSEPMDAGPPERPALPGLPSEGERGRVVEEGCACVRGTRLAARGAVPAGSWLGLGVVGLGLALGLRRAQKQLAGPRGRTAST